MTTTDPKTDACATPVPTDLVPYRITICGLRELMIHAEKGVSHVITILDPSYPDPEVFDIYPKHERVVWRFDDHVTPVEGAVMPDSQIVDRILDLGETFRSAPVEHLLIHCHAGVSRSTATAAILMAQFNPGREEEVFTQLRRIRPRSWPNSLLVTMADDKLGRNGAMVAAMAKLHDMTARDYPELAEYLRIHGRAHEVRQG